MHEILGLSELSVVSGLTRDDATEQFRGFLTVRATGDNGTIMIGQLSPDEVRSTALRFLEAAESADQDCLVMRMLTKDLGISDQNAAGFISAMRDERDKMEAEAAGEDAGIESITIEVPGDGEVFLEGMLPTGEEGVFVQPSEEDFPPEAS